MKNENKNIITSRWLRSFCFLVVVYFSQVYPFYHLHHIHKDSFLDFEISSHPLEVEVDHSSDHHHEEDASHTKDHQHAFDKYINWNIIRTQKPKTLTFYDQHILPYIPFILNNDNNISCYELSALLYNDDNFVTLKTIRGPPSLG